MARDRSPGDRHMVSLTTTGLAACASRRSSDRLVSELWSSCDDARRVGGLGPRLRQQQVQPSAARITPNAQSNTETGCRTNLSNGAALLPGLREASITCTCSFQTGFFPVRRSTKADRQKPRSAQPSGIGSLHSGLRRGCCSTYKRSI
jgi:hypothetical protein